MLDSTILTLTKDLFGSAYSLNELGFFYYFINYRQISFYLYDYAVSLTTLPSFNQTQQKLLGWNLSQFITKCSFNNIPCDLNNDFQWYFSGDYGNCYHFNGAPKVNLKKRLKILVKAKQKKIPPIEE